MAGHGPKEGELIAAINITPMVDIVLVLLIIFIVTAKIVVTPAVPLDLPKAATTEDVQVILSLIEQADGTVLIDGEPAADDAAITSAAAAALARNPELRAVIDADGGVPHRKVLHLLDLLRQSHVVHVAFAAAHEEATR